MFSENNPAFGLDISDLSIKLALLEEDSRHINLVSFNRQEINDGVIEGGVIKKEGDLLEQIKKAVQQAKGPKIKTKKCIVSLPETESYIRVVQLPKMREEEIPEAIKWEIEANIPMPIADLYFDWQVLEGGAFSRNSLDILIGALPKVLIDPYLEVLRKAGLTPIAFEIESIATARSLIKNEDCDDPLMIIDIGSKKCSLIIYSCGAIWFTTSLPVSNYDLVNDISKKLGIDKIEAREFKNKVGLDISQQKGKVSKAMESRLLELAGEISRYFDYYQASSLAGRVPKTNISKIILCGGGANLKGLPAFLSSKLKVEVAVGNPWVNILAPDSDKLPKIPFSESLSYATALGLALRGLNP